MSNEPILVIGATGKTGRRVANRLEMKGVEVRRASRRSPIPFDWSKPETFGPALSGVRSAYITFHPDLSVPGAAEAITALTAVAREKGVRKLVLLSGRGEEHAEACEEIIRHSGLAFTLVRCAWFAQNFSEGDFRPAVMDGVIALPAGTLKEPLVDADDIADIVVAALTEPGHDGELYEVTGPRLLDFAEVAATLSAASGRPVRYESISFEAFRAGLIPVAGVEYADLVTGIARETMDGSNAWVGDGVERALGRPAKDFADFCRDAAAAGAWAEPGAAAA